MVGNILLRWSTQACKESKRRLHPFFLSGMSPKLHLPESVLRTWLRIHLHILGPGPEALHAEQRPRGTLLSWRLGRHDGRIRSFLPPLCLGPLKQIKYMFSDRFPFYNQQGEIRHVLKQMEVTGPSGRLKGNHKKNCRHNEPGSIATRHNCRDRTWSSWDLFLPWIAGFAPAHLASTWTLFATLKTVSLAPSNIHSNCPQHDP